MASYRMSEQSQFRQFKSNMDETNRENSQSLYRAMNAFVQAVEEMDATVMIPSRLKDVSVEKLNGISKTNNETAVVPICNANADLYSFYQMVNAIKTELVVGHEEEIENDRHVDENSRKTAALFRHHIKGLFSVLKQLTNTANYLSSRYQEELLGDSNVLPL